MSWVSTPFHVGQAVQSSSGWTGGVQGEGLTWQSLEYLQHTLVTADVWKACGILSSGLSLLTMCIPYTFSPKLATSDLRP